MTDNEQIDAELAALDARADEVIETVKKPRRTDSRRTRVERAILYFLLAAMLIGGPAVYVTYKIAHTAEQNLALLCPVFRSVATSTIPPATTPVQGTPTGIQIIGQLRIAYEAYCVPGYGKLPAPTDQRLIDFLRSQGH